MPAQRLEWPVLKYVHMCDAYSHMIMQYPSGIHQSIHSTGDGGAGDE